MTTAVAAGRERAIHDYFFPGTGGAPYSEITDGGGGSGAEAEGGGATAEVVGAADALVEGAAVGTGSGVGGPP